MGAIYGTSDAGLLRLWTDIYHTTGWNSPGDDRAVIAAAIAARESGGNPNALGDTTIQDLESDRTTFMRANGTYWGPSVGLFQIRTIHFGKGNTLGPAPYPERSYKAMMPTFGDGNAIQQILNMQRISGNGASWGQWVNGANIKVWTDAGTGAYYQRIRALVNKSGGATIDTGTTEVPIPGQGVVANVGNAIAAPFKAVASVAEAISRAGAWLFNPTNEWRIVEVSLGGVMIVAVLRKSV
jgi:hypothetical protein